MSNMRKYWFDFSKKLIKTLDDQNVFITGPAGVGKSTFLKYFRDYAIGKNIKVSLTAMTGVAAINIKGITIHRLLGIEIKTSLSQFRKSFWTSDSWKRVKKRINNLDIIVLDEVSMLRSDTLSLIDKILRQATDIDDVFGGKKIIFVGDFYQLAPIVKRDENVKYPYAFQSKIWLQANIKTIFLDKVHRQTDKNFIDMLHKIRNNTFDKEAENLIQKISNKDIDDDCIKFVSTNTKAKEYNLKKLDNLEGIKKTYLSTSWGKNSKYEKDISSGTIAEEKLILKKGAKVMILINDEKARFWNGSLGEITFLGNESVTVKLDSNEKKINISKYTWETIDQDGNITATFDQIPVKLAYAVTIHKSQGLTFDKAVVDCSNIFTYGQLYVALSRVKSIEGLYLIGFNRSKIKVNKNVDLFYNWTRIKTQM